MYQYLDDTWTYDGHQWKKLQGRGPRPREYASIAYDAATGQVVLFGGIGCQSLDGVGAGSAPGGTGDGPGYCGDTWTFNGTTWSEVAGPGPSARPVTRT